jgi:diguanylate cyclase (GGDEF)-like protein
MAIPRNQPRPRRYLARLQTKSKVAPVATSAPDARRETNGITSRLVLLYVEQAGGQDAVDRVLARCGMSDRREELLDENYWFSYDKKIALFEAASEVLEDPNVMLSISSRALDLNVAGGLKLALRALGSPRLVYQNIVRANAKFSGSHVMELLDVGPRHAVISYADLTSAHRFHELDCQYNRGMLACVPELFGLGPAHVEHQVCGCRGGPACLYSLRWESGGNDVRFALGAALVGGAALAGTAIFDPPLLPVGAAVAGIAAVTAGMRAAHQERAVRRHLETDAREQSEVAESLITSLQDLVSELRLDEVLAKVTANAQSAVGGKEFALLVDEGDGPRCQSYTSLPLAAISVLESWAQGMATGEHPVTVDDVMMVPDLARLARDPDLPFGSICAAPLVFRGRHLGVLVALATQPRTFLPRDLDLIQSYAAQAAIALANARMYQELEELASRDHLTGLLNLREFHDSLTRELERCKRYGGRFSIILFDLNGFKEVNDSHGHAEGDRVLREAGGAFARTCRSSDLAFRVGGDEFAYILPESGQDAATAAAARAREALAALPERLDCCYGITVWPTDGPERAALLETADARLYEMKREHRPDGPERVL